MRSIIGCVVCLLALSISIGKSAKMSYRLPFEKANIIYHRQKLCMLKPGNEKCIHREDNPGDARVVADRFNFLQEVEYESVTYKEKRPLQQDRRKRPQ